jgi:hypothetical protein
MQADDRINHSFTLCYTKWDMPDCSYWTEWAQFLQRWGLDSAAAEVLDGGAPVNLVLAQFLYLGQPLLGSAAKLEKWQALGQLLENQDESRQFAAFLRKEEIY